MKWLLLVLGLTAIAIVLALLVGSRLPRQHVATRSAVSHLPAAVLFAAIRDLATQPAWRPHLKRVEVLPPTSGRPRFREVSKAGAVLYEVVEEHAPTRLVIRIADDTLPYGGTWTFELSPTGDATRVRITENGEVKNPVFRFLARFLFGHTASLETYLRDLGRKFGETVTLEP